MAYNLMKIFLALAVIGIIELACLKINYLRNFRYKQWKIILASVVYSILGVTGILLYREDLLQLTYDIGVLAWSDILLFNIYVGIGYVAFKACFIVIARLLSKLLDFEEDLTEKRFYFYDDFYGRWFLKVGWANIRNLIFVITLVLYLLTSIYLGLTWVFGPTTNVWVYMFPIVAMIIMTEIHNLFDGYTRTEYANLFYGDDAEFLRISSFNKMKEIYEKLFPENVLASNTDTHLYSRKQGVTEKIAQLKKSENSIERIAGKYFDVYDSPDKLDSDFMDVSVQLMNSENVVFFNPFYRDLGVYMILPITNMLLSSKKVLIVVGRNSLKEDVCEWITEIFKEYNNLSSLWRIMQLGQFEQECEIGILTASQLHNVRTIEANREFLNDTGMVIMIEPSLVSTTSQIGLGIIADEVAKKDKPVYCLIDRSCDGLIDTMSHVLKSEFVKVSPTPEPRCNGTIMGWNASGDFDRQGLFDRETKYLGNGVELAAIAVKNQVKEVYWYSATKAPVKDIKWISGQFYSLLNKFMGLPPKLGVYDNKIHFESNLWGAEQERDKFVIAEDEFCNLYSMLKVFLSRGTEQSFVNVLSENYLLRDYMRCNPRIFLSNPNTIPSMIADYAKTERNTIIKLILLMSVRNVYRSEVLTELRLLGIETEEVFHSLVDLTKKYFNVDESLFTVSSFVDDSNNPIAEPEEAYCISNIDFGRNFLQSLNTAYYICEEENYNTEYLDVKLYGLVTQALLPGQYITYDGKYYLVKSISSQGGVILRRASDLYTERKYYKQIRRYHLENPDGVIENHKYTMMDIEFVEMVKNITVTTSGYLEMKSYDDLRSARLYKFADDSDEKYNREYKCKSVLRIKLPETDDKIRFTICMMLQEMFKTIYPDLWPYIVVTTSRPEHIEGMLNYTVYEIDGDYNEEYIYIIEDSDIDLGVLSSVENNFTKFMEILADYISWHFEKLREPAQSDPEPKSIQMPPDKELEKEKRSFLRRRSKLDHTKNEKDIVIEKVESVEKKKRPDSEEKPESVEQKPVEQSNSGHFTLDADVSGEMEQNGIHDEGEESTFTMTENETEEVVGNENSDYDDIQKKRRENADEISQTDIVDIDGTDIFDEEPDPDIDEYLKDEFLIRGIETLDKTRYQRECFLKFGFNEIDSRLYLNEIRTYLTSRGWADNALRRARNYQIIDAEESSLEAENTCDFCGRPLSGVSYEQMNDGRIRCNECSASAINSEQEFVELFGSIMSTMMSFYKIKFKLPVIARMTDAHTLAKHGGTSFVPSRNVAARALGFAKKDKGSFKLFIENGSPRLAATATSAHELTHIWQFTNWEEKDIDARYGRNTNRLLVYEGMARWAEIQYLFIIGESSYAEQLMLSTRLSNDEYGIGFELYFQKYGIAIDGTIPKYTPFNTYPPL